MSMLFTLAWRNIWRNRRRSVLTIVAITFATVLTVIFRGLAIGTWEYNVRSTVEMFSGYLQVEREGYADAPSLNKSFPFPATVDSVIKAVPMVTGSAPRVMADGLVCYRENSSGAAIVGMDPVAEQHVSRLSDRVRQGRMFKADSRNQAVLGYKLMETLKAGIGDTIVILANGFDGVMGNQKIVVTGALKSGSPEFDAMTILMDIGAVQELLAMDGRATIVALAARSLNDVMDIRENLTRSLRRAALSQLEVLPWDQVMPELKQAMEFDMVNDWIFLAVLIVIVAFGILNTVLMSVTERFREFGISLAIGMPTRMLVRLVFIETFWISCLGVVLGAALGQALNVYVAHNPIKLTGRLAAFYEEYGFIPMILSDPSPAIAAEVSLLILAIALFACLYPAYRVSRLEPLKGIRYT